MQLIFFGALFGFSGLRAYEHPFVGSKGLEQLLGKPMPLADQPLAASFAIITNRLCARPGSIIKLFGKEDMSTFTTPARLIPFDFLRKRLWSCNGGCKQLSLCLLGEEPHKNVSKTTNRFCKRTTGGIPFRRGGRVNA